MRKKYTLYPMIVMLVLLLAACAPQASQPPAPSAAPAKDGFEDTHWSLVSYGPVGAENPIVEGSNVTLLAADGRFGGSGGCNSYGGAYEITGDQLSLRNINSTLIACVDGKITQQEQRYFEALQSTRAFEVKANHLIITYDGGKGVLEFEKALITGG